MGMQILESVGSSISHKLDCLEKGDHQNFFKVQEEVLVAMQISVSVRKYYFPSRKTASKCVILKIISKSQRGGGSGENVIFTR